MEVRMYDASDEPISVLYVNHDGQEYVNIKFGEDEDTGCVELTHDQLEDFIDALRFIGKRVK